mmetsp:Transcript_23800/g.57390  ORF Transcript_23800/g.57390 Transcript_23800/m.57390 type:complete len:174 (+) Transcript_23800:1071-1592(+)
MLALHYPLQLDPSRRCLISLVSVILNWWRQKHSKRGNDVSKSVSGERSGEIEMEQDESSKADGRYMSEDLPYHAISHDDAKQEKVEESDDALFYVITISFLSLSFILAMIVDDLGVILALVGATGSTLVSYILPGLLYIKVYHHMDLSMAMAFVQLGLGIVIIPIALYFIISK